MRSGFFFLFAAIKISHLKNPEFHSESYFVSSALNFSKLAGFSDGKT
jgi:hypothetical protein